MVRIRILRKRVHSCIVGTQCAFILMRTVRIVKNNYLHHWYTLWSCQNVCDALSYLLDNIYIRFATKLYRQIVGIPMGTNCAPLVADLFLYCYERDFMDSLNHDNQADVIEAFNSTSRYLDDLLNIDNPYFEGMVNQIYASELQLNKANISDTEAPFLDLHLSVANGFVSPKIYDKRDDFDFDIVNFPFLDGDVLLCRTSGPAGQGSITEQEVRAPGTDENQEVVPMKNWTLTMMIRLVKKV